jgi:hypothetical protein
MVSIADVVPLAGHGLGVLRGVIVTVIMIIILSAHRPRIAHRIMLLACFSQILQEHVRRFLQGAIWQHWCCWGLAPPSMVQGPPMELSAPCIAK